MPFLEDAPATGLAPQGEYKLNIDTPLPPFEKLLEAAHKDQGFTAALSSLADATRAAFDPGFDPWGNIKGYEDYAAAFSGDNTSDEVNRTKRKIDEERRRTDMLSEAGASGMAAGVIAGIANPINLIPVGGQVYRVGGIGSRFLAGAARVGAAGAGSAAADEVLAHRFMETRTAGESAINIAASGLLAGVLGGAASGLSRAETRALADGLYRRGDIFEREFTANTHADASTVGAAAVRGTTLEQETLTSALGAEKALAFGFPTMRLANSADVEVRRLVQELADIPLEFRKNAEGIPTPVSVESRIRMWQAPLYESMTGIDDLFVKYRLGREPKWGDVAKIGVSDLVSRPDKLSYNEFLEAIGKSMRRADQSDIPEVAQAAALARKKLFDPLKDRAIEHGLLPPDVQVDTALSYLTRVYNLPKIAARRPEFEQRVVDWLSKLQAETKGRVGEKETALQTETARKETAGAGLPAKKVLFADTTQHASSLTSQFQKTDTELKLADRSMRKAVAARDKAQERLAKFAPTPDAVTDVETRQLIRDLRRGVTKEPIDENDADALMRNEFIAEVAAELERRSVNISKLSDEELLAHIAGTADEFRANTPAARAKSREIAFNLRRAITEVDGATEKVKVLQAEWDRLKADVDAATGAAKRLRDEISTAERELGRAERAVDKLTKKIGEDREFSTLETLDLRDIARQLVDGLMHASPGRTNYTPIPLKRGPLKERTFSIPDEDIEDFLESNIRHVSRIYTRTMSADVELTRQFGRADMQEQIDRVLERYAVLREGVTDERKLKALNAEMTDDLRDLSAIRDRLRHTYALPDNPNGLAERAWRVVRDLNYLRLMGGMTLSSIPDAGRTVMVHGIMRTFRDGVVPMVKNFQGFRLSAQETKLAGTALDMALDTRAMQMADVLDDYGRWSKLERGIQGATSYFGIASLMAPWNAAMKQFAGMISQTRTLQAIQGMADGSASQKELTRLAALGIGKTQAAKIAKQFAAHGEENKGTLWANTSAWTDPEAVEAFRNALAKEVDATIISPGQEKPLWMSKGIGRMLGQFRSFSMSSTQRVLISGLQQRDMATLNGAMLMTGLGMLSYWLKTDSQKLSDIPGVWISEGVDRSGLTGYLYDVNNIMEKATRGAVGVSALTKGPTASRYQSRGILESILGPTPGLVNDAAQIVGATANGDWKEADTRAVRRMIPAQNLIVWKHLFDEAEEGVNDVLGVPVSAAR